VDAVDLKADGGMMAKGGSVKTRLLQQQREMRSKPHIVVNNDEMVVLKEFKNYNSAMKFVEEYLDENEDKYGTLTIMPKESTYASDYMAKGGSVGNIYYHILEYGDYGNIGYQGYYETEEEAKKEINRLSGYFPDMYYEIFTSDSMQEPPVTTMADGGEVWKKGTTTRFKTKADAQRSLNLMKNSNESNKFFKNLKIEKVTDGWAVKFDFQDKMARGGETEIFEKFMKSQIEYIISLKSISEKKKDINLLLSNMNDYVGDEMQKRITTDNLKYALNQKTASAINNVLKTSLNALKSGEQMAKGGRLSRKEKQLDLNKNGKLDSQDFKMLRAGRKNARKK
jgi:hypothetical protein